MRTICKIIDKIAYYMFLIGVFSGVMMTVVVFVSTLMRYVLNSPIHFSNELAGLLFLSITFLTIPHVLNIDRHISIDLIVKKLPRQLKSYTGVLSSLVTVVFSLIFIYESWGFVSFSQSISSRSDISGILLWPWMMLMPISFVMCIIIKLKNLFMFNGKNEVETFPAEARS